MKALGWRLLSHAQAGLPVLAAALLAAFTWWLVQSSPQGASTGTKAASPNTPDFTLQQAHVARVDPSGRLQGLLNGQAMRHYVDQDRLEIDEVELSAREADEQGLHAVARQGRANGQADVLSLSGGVDVVATPSAQRVAGAGLRSGPVRITGEGLVLDNARRMVVSEQAVTLSQGGNVVHAQALRYNAQTGISDLQGRVTGRYELSR